MGCGVPIIHSSHPHIVDSRLLLSLTLHSLYHLLYVISTVAVAGVKVYLYDAASQVGTSQDKPDPG